MLIDPKIYFISNQKCFFLKKKEFRNGKLFFVLREFKFSQSSIGAMRVQ